MFNPEIFKTQLFKLSDENFEHAALSLFDYQWHSNPTYQSYCKALGIDPSGIKKVHQIPFLPIDFFKTHEIKSNAWESEKIFLSSGTTSANRSKHFVKSESYYHQISKFLFEQTFGPLQEYTIIALLPSYQENPQSSLISMIDFFMKESANNYPIYLNDINLNQFDMDIIKNNKVMLFGVTYSLLDHLAFLKNFKSHPLTIIETGGMKGRKKEMIREEVHKQLKKAVGVAPIYSEYGMTELMSQSYGLAGIFSQLPWFKVFIRDINDPFDFAAKGTTGGINIIDLANVDSCAFIETKDLGKMVGIDHFEVIGRFDNSDIRGCSLLT